MSISEKKPFWLYKLEKNTPEMIRKLEIYVLMKLTAASCGNKAPSMRGMKSRDCLKLYRDFTVKCVNDFDKDKISSFRESMYQRAFKTGKLLSMLPGLKSVESRKRLVILLYKIIEIEIIYPNSAGNTEDITNSSKRSNGEMDLFNIHIPHCSFSHAYTPRTCYVMSGLDAGIFCGIFGKGKFEFEQRITEGCRHCSAIYRKYGDGI